MTAPPLPDEFHVRLAPATRALLEEIKRDGGFESDAEAIRAALALQHHLVRRVSEGFHLVLRKPGKSDRTLTMGTRHER